jgi:hypothetical protein
MVAGASSTSRMSSFIAAPTIGALDGRSIGINRNLGQGGTRRRVSDWSERSPIDKRSSRALASASRSGAAGKAFRDLRAGNLRAAATLTLLTPRSRRANVSGSQRIVAQPGAPHDAPLVRHRDFCLPDLHPAGRWRAGCGRVHHGAWRHDVDFTLQSALRLTLLGSVLSPDFVTESAGAAVRRARRWNEVPSGDERFPRPVPHPELCDRSRESTRARRCQAVHRISFHWR